MGKVRITSGKVNTRHIKETTMETMEWAKQSEEMFKTWTETQRRCGKTA